MRAAAIGVALAGLGIAAYLTVVHYSGGEPVCAIAHGCAVVQSSEYSELAGVPVAVLGLLGYLGVLAALARDGEGGPPAPPLLSLAGLGFSAWLTYVEVGVLHAVCIWCVGSAVCMGLLSALTVRRMVSAP